MKKILLALFCFGYVTGFTQYRTIASQNHAWFVYTGIFKLHKNINLYSEYQFRRNHWVKNPQQSLARIGLELKLNSALSFMVGYGWIVTYPYGKQPVAYMFNEHRAWEQVSLNHDLEKLKIQHRYRLEQRWLEQKKLSTNEYAFSHYMYVNRFRYRLQLNYPLFTFNTTQKLNALISDEVFIGFGKNVNKNVFDQNRIYMGLSFMHSKALNLSLGYVNQFVVKASGSFAESNQTLQVGINLTI